MNSTLRFLDPEILSNISGMELRARTVVEGFLSGLHRSPYKGFSVEFAEYRQYTPGDDPRHIDWKVYARSDRYYVKEFEEETNLNCHILLDLSRSMSYASKKISKREYATYLAAALAFFIFHQRDAVGLIAFDSAIRTHVPAKVRPGHLHAILTELESLPPGERTTSITAPLHEIAERLQKKGMSILISDLLDDPAEILHGLEHTRFKGHDVIVFQILDPAEIDFSFDHLTRFEGLEGEAPAVAMPMEMRAAYLARKEEHLSALREGCGVQHIDYCLLSTAQPLDFALYSYLAARSNRQ